MGDGEAWSSGCASWRPASGKPESATLPGCPWRSEPGYAEISHVNDNLMRSSSRVNGPPLGVLVAGFEPARACAQRCERSLRLPVSPHQHLVGCEPRQSRRPRRETSHVLPPAGRQYALTGASLAPRKREPCRKAAPLTPGASPGITRTGRRGWEDPRVVRRRGFVNPRPERARSAVSAPLQGARPRRARALSPGIPR